MKKVQICLNADLADNLGNLLSRCTSKKLNAKQQFPHFTKTELNRILPESLEIVDEALTLSSKCYSAYLNGNFYIGIMEVMNYLNSINSLVTSTQPWNLVNSSQDKERLDSILYVSLESIRICAILLSPVIPMSSTFILNKLNMSEQSRTWKSVENAFNDNEVDDIREISDNKYIVYTKLY